MRSSRIRAVLVLCTAAMGFIFLCGFEPEDIIYDECRKQKAYDADCAGFVAEGAGEARSVILLIGDGMGIGQTYAGRVYLNGPDQPLAWEELPFQGLVSTCAIGAVTDSAAAGTALSTGRKTENGAISVGPPPHYTRHQTILEQIRAHKATGLVTNTGLSHATPAVFAAHVRKRSQGIEIARQMIEDTGADVMMGGGARVFSGMRGPDLAARARELGYQVVRTNEELKAVDTGEATRLLGLFAKGHMTYEAERPEDSTEPHLSEMTEVALDILGRDPRGFFLMIEGGRIDHACHAADMDKTLAEMVEFDRTVDLILDWARDHPHTLVIITADHETCGIEVMPGEYKPGDKVEVRWTSRILFIVPHSSQQVPVYATGPNAGAIRPHLDNTEVYCIMKNAFRIQGH